MQEFRTIQDACFSCGPTIDHGAVGVVNMTAMHKWLVDLTKTGIYTKSLKNGNIAAKKATSFSRNNVESYNKTRFVLITVSQKYRIFKAVSVTESVNVDRHQSGRIKNLSNAKRVQLSMKIQYSV